MKKYLLVLGAAVASFNAAAADNGVYAGATYSNFTLKDSNLPGISIDLGSLGVIGGYQFNENFAIEGRAATGVQDANVLGAINVKLDSYVGANVVGLLPLSNGFSGYGTLGYGQAKITASGGGTTVSGSESSINYGAGLQYRTNSVTVRAGYESLFDKSGTTARGFTLTGLFHF